MQTEFLNHLVPSTSLDLEGYQLELQMALTLLDQALLSTCKGGVRVVCNGLMVETEFKMRLEMQSLELIERICFLETYQAYLEWLKLWEIEILRI